MKKITVLITGGGSPGIAGTIHSMRNNYDNRDIFIISTDVKPNCVGKYLADKFYQIPHSSDQKDYLRKLMDICRNEKIDVILPQNTLELNLLSKSRELFSPLGTSIAVSCYKAMKTANDKFELLKLCKRLSIPYPEFYLVKDRLQLLDAAKRLGWPHKPFVVKPPNSNGSRGLRIIDENKNYKKLFYNEKPSNLFIRLEQLISILNENFDEIIAMEYLPGNEITIDVFRDSSNFISIPRIREEIRSGISFVNYALNDEKLMRYSKIISEYLDMQYCFGYQFKYDEEGIPKILECNPRVQGTMIFATFMGANLVYSSIKSCIGEHIPSFLLDWETSLLRYWGALGVTSRGKMIV